MRAALALLLALACGPAVADPVTIATIATYAAQAYGAISATTAFWLTVAIAAVGAANARRKARKVAAQQRAEYNASLQDRTVTVLRGDPPWQVVYGRCIVGGAIVDIVTSDKPGAHRDNGEIYTKADAYKHMVIVLAAHEVQAIHEVYIDGVAVGALDGSGWVTAGDFFTERTDARRVVFTGSTTPAEAPLQVLQAFSVEGVGESQSFIPRTVTISGGTTLVGPPDTEVICDYLVQDDIRAVRISKHLGGAGQAVDAFLAAAAPTRYTAAHKLEGLAYIVVTLDLEDVRFQGGPPNITADVSGRLLYDPRTSTTAWSANPALVVRDFLTAEWGYGADPATEIDDAYVIAAANACDELITLTVGATVTTNQRRYTCNGAFTTDAATEATLEDLAASMAGTVAYGGSWQVMAGAWTAPVMALTDDDLHGMVEVAQADTPMDDLANGIRGQYIASGTQTPTDYNTYQNATFLAADNGRELWLNVNLPYTDHLARARNLCRVMLESNRAGQVLRYPAKLRAWPLQVGDRVTVTCAEYGLTAKTYRVTDWQFDIAAPVLLTLQEDAEEIYDLADAAVADPTPNTDLPNPWLVAAMADVVATSGSSTLLQLADGSLLPRVRVAWTARTDAYVTEGGRIEVLWRRSNQAETQQTAVPGSEIAAWIVGVDAGDQLMIEVRAVNSLGARSVSTYLSHTVVGKEGAPSDVTGLAWLIKPGQVQISWSPSVDADYAATELRYGGTGWDDATFLWRGHGTDYQHPRPANGTYAVRAKHVDTGGNYSTNAATVTVTVDDSIDPGAGESVYVEYSVNGSTLWHTTFAAGDLYARWKIGVGGAWNGPFRIVGETGAAGDYTDFIFRRSASQPATPTGDNPAGWSDAPPAANGNPLWASTGTKTAAGTLVGVWSTPVQIEGPQGETGASGLNTAIVYAYRRNATAPGGPSLSCTYTFSTKTLTGLNNSWTTTIPAGTDPLWVVAASAASATDTDTIVSTDWSTSQQISGNDGAAGLNAATVYLYQRTSSATAPALPSTTLTYTFATGVLTGTLGSWSQTIPAAGGDYVHVTTATAVSSASTDTIPSTEWAAARVLSAPGTEGARGSLVLYSSSVSPTVNLSGTTWPLDITSPFGTNDNNALKIVWVALGNSAASFVNNTVSHMRIGDTVTLVNSAGDTAIQKYWTGSYWADPGVVISGNLLVGGTISGGTNLNITGTAIFEGLNSLTLTIGNSSTSTNAAVIANTSNAAELGVAATSSTAARPAVYGYNANATGQGVRGEAGAGDGVVGFATSGNAVKASALTGDGVDATGGLSGAAVRATAASGATAKALVATGFSTLDGPSDARTLLVTSGAGASAKAIEASSASGMALEVTGKSTFSGQITSTISAGTAPFAVPAGSAVCANLNVGLLNGKTWAAPDPIGATTPSTGRFTTLRVDATPTASGANAATFSGLLPTGSVASTNTWMPINLNGTQYWIPVWVD